MSADLTDAVRKAHELTTVHNEQFAKLLTPEGGVAHLTKQIVNIAMEQAKDPDLSDEQRPWGDYWRDWKQMLTHFGQDAGQLSDTTKADYLASCLTSAFGLTDLIQEIVSPYARALAERETREPLPPTEAGDLTCPFSQGRS